MTNRVSILAQKLISIKSTAENKRALDQALLFALSNLKGYQVERFHNKGVESVLIYNTQKKPKKFKILLNGHLDVVPGKEYQYEPKIKGDRLYGVGSMDMKASVACLIMVFDELANKVKYPLGLQLVTDEEIGGFNGTKYQIDKGIKADFVIAGESTSLNIVNKAKGIIWAKISSKGKTAHGAYPWKGVNAIWQMNKFLNLLEKSYPIPSKEIWKTTVNLSRIETTNQALNKIPDDCTVWLDIRYIPEDSDNIIDSLKKMMPAQFKLEIITKEPPLFVKDDNHYLKILKKQGELVTNKKVVLYGAQGTSDARHFTKVNIDGIEFGPTGGNIGADNEWVSIKSLEQYCQILKNFLFSL